MSSSSSSFSATLARFSGFAHDYDQYRPQPPEALPTAISMIGRRDRPALIVDLDSDSGLSSRYWSARARTGVR